MVPRTLVITFSIRKYLKKTRSFKLNKGKFERSFQNLGMSTTFLALRSGCYNTKLVV